MQNFTGVGPWQLEVDEAAFYAFAEEHQLSYQKNASVSHSCVGTAYSSQMGVGHLLYKQLFEAVILGVRFFYDRASKSSDKTVTRRFLEKVPKRTIVMTPGQPNRGVRDWSFAKGCLHLVLDPITIRYAKEPLMQAVDADLLHMSTA